jgi:4,5-dihydroxyphthalate decarboxylase
MAKLKLTFAAGDYEIVRPLKDGLVEVDGIELVMLTSIGSRERHWRMARRAEFDLCELNVGAYFMARDQGEPLSALPVFLHRRFRHGFIFVNANAGIREPKDLIGKRIGGTNFQPASNIWMRGVLEEHYGVPHRQNTWVVEREEDLEFKRPADLKIEMIPPDKKLDVMLAEGELPAMLSPDIPRRFLQGDKRIVRLFPDYKQVEIDYYRQTGIFPIMHVTAIKREIVEKYPWVPTNLVKALDKAKALAYRRIANPRVAPLAWVRTAVEEQQQILGPDPWEYGLSERNRNNLGTVLRYTRQQGMVKRDFALDDLFEPTDLGDAGGDEGI